nr:S9 family peptidase [Armatimonadota bacterium]
MPNTTPPIPSPPPTRAEPITDILPGVPVSDPYRWLEDAWSDETRRWIDDQNAFTQSIVSALPGREDLQQRLSQIMKVDVVGTPVERGGRYFFSRRRATEDLYVIVMRESHHGPDIVLIDPHPMSADYSTSVQLWDVSDDGRRLVYGVRLGGEDEQEIRLLDVDNRQDLPDSLPRARYFTVSITPDGEGLYYSRHGAEGSRVAFHSIGHPEADRPIFGEGYGPEKIITADLSEDGRTLLFTVSHGAGARKTELYVQDVEHDGPIRTIVADLDARFEGHCIGEELFILSDWEAPRGHIFRVDWGDPDRSHWREIVPEGDGVIESFSLVGGRLFTNELYSVSSRLWIFDTDGASLGEIPLPGLGSASGPSGRWLSEEAFYGFTSFAVPWTLYQFNVGDGTQAVWERSQTPVDSSWLEVRQVRYASKDGTEIPMFLVHRTGLQMDGDRPVLLTGYGGFNASLTPAFSARAALWAERG